MCINKKNKGAPRPFIPIKRCLVNRVTALCQSYISSRFDVDGDVLLLIEMRRRDCFFLLLLYIFPPPFFSFYCQESVLYYTSKNVVLENDIKFKLNRFCKSESQLFFFFL